VSFPLFTDLQVISFGPVPAAHNPIITTLGRTSSPITVELKNAATNGDGNEIIKAKGDRVNFKVIGYYANGAGDDISKAVGLYRLNFSIPMIELQYGIAPQGSVSLRGRFWHKEDSRHIQLVME
jgi:hypothetical protein